MEDSQKVITFIDVGGNERYTKSLIKGLCVHYPDYALIVVDAVQCAERGCKIEESVLDNFRIAFAFQVPVVIVLTKIDALAQISDQMKLDIDADELLDDIVYELRT